jgi:hypothetical protein
MTMKRIALVIIPLAIACGVALALSPLGKQARYLWHQHQISRQVLPTGVVIYTEDAARIASVRGRPDYREKGKHAPGYPTNAPAAWERTWTQGSLEAHWSQPGGEMAYHAMDDTFCWPRTSAGGIKWVVNLGQVNPFQAAEGRRRVSLTQSTFRPAGWKIGDRAVVVSFMSEQVLLKPSDVFTMFAPRLDPNDSSRVNVPYELNGQSGMLDAVVTDRGYVQISVRSGPAQMVKWNG